MAVEEQTPAGTQEPSAVTEAKKAKATDITETGGTETQKPSTEDKNDEEPYGVSLLTKELLGRAEDIFTRSRALDNATRALGLQVNYFGTPTGGDRVRIEGVTAETLTRVRKSFVAPPGYQDLWHRMMDRSLLILRGRPGWGRDHLAIHLLDAFCDARISRMTGRVLTELKSDDLAVGRGYLWAGPLGPDGLTMDLEMAEALIDILRHRDCRMIVFWPHGEVWQPELAEHSYLMAGPPDFAAVLRLSLQPDTVADFEAQWQSLSAQPEVAAARAGLTAAHQAARLGGALSEVLRGRSTLAETMAELDAASHDIADWFGALSEEPDRAFALALAALDGLSFPTVVKGALLVDELIQRAEDPEGRSRIRPLVRPARRLLRALEAERVSDVLETTYGAVPIVAVRSTRRDYSQNMLATIWHEYPYLHEIYLTWLDRLVREGDFYVRERAALVAGVLAEQDFDFVLGRLVQDWAQNADGKLRRAAATALRPSVLGGRLAALVWDLLDQWATDSERTGEAGNHLRLTAATALGGPVGAADVIRALDIIERRLLKHAANNYDYPLWVATASTVTELFGGGGSRESREVLQRLSSWLDIKDVGAENTVFAALIALAGKPPEAELPEAELPEAHRTAPLLRAIAGDETNLPRIADLWRQALNNRVMESASLEALGYLAEHVQRSGGGEPELMRLALAIPRTPREHRTLVFEARRWTQVEPHSPIFDRLHETLRLHEVSR
jgi:hypothetical protein